jgi:hypothetical protein
MPFLNSSLIMIAVGGAIGAPPGNTRDLYAYATDDPRSVVEAAGYFNNAAGRLKVGDTIKVSSIGSPVFTNSYVVASNANGVVAVTSDASGRIFLPYVIGQTDLLAPTSTELVSPVAGTIVGHRATVQVAIGTGGTLTPRINGVAVTGGVATIANAAAKGTRVNGTAITAANAVTVGERIEILPASFATAGAVAGIIEILPSS